MRHASYLTKSRHGIYYFRWPVPPSLHPEGKPSDVKISTGTRCPQHAREVSRYLTVAGQSRRLRSSLTRMRYDEVREHVREHFRDLLDKHRASVAKNGPASPATLDGVEGTVALAENTTPEEWADLLHEDGPDGLVDEFCVQRGIVAPPNAEARQWVLSALHAGYRANLSGILDFQQSLTTIDLSETREKACPAPTHTEIEQPAFDDVVKAYFDELARTAPLASKTLGDKRDALALLSEITGAKPVGALTRADARGVKDVLMRLPKNRRKCPETRDLTLPEMLEVQGVERISARTLNTYIGNMQTFLGWALRNGYAEDNVLEGMRMRAAKSGKDNGRIAFSSHQLQTMHRHLSENPDGLVPKTAHRWVTLISMFTGMRLNEVAQLRKADIKEEEGVLFFDVNTEDPRLRTHSQ